MSDLSAPEGQTGNIPEKPLVLQNLAFYNESFEPEMVKDLAEGFIASSTSYGIIDRTEAGACLRGKNSAYKNITSNTRYNLGGRMAESTHTVITEEEMLPDGKKAVRGFEFFRGPGTKGEEPAMIELMNADPAMTREQRQMAIKEIMSGYLAADVYQPDNDAMVEQLRKNTTIPENRSNQR